eukprot:10200292-Alexandrium_andersonii.AAC.1
MQTPGRRGGAGPRESPLLVWRPGGAPARDLPLRDCSERGRHTTQRRAALGPCCRLCHAAWLLRNCLRPHGSQLAPREATALEAAVLGLTHSV